MLLLKMKSLRALSIIAALCAITLAAGGCASTSDDRDETAGMSEQKIFSEAKQELSNGGYERAIKLFERLEARFPFGVLAQQAQLEIAYAYYKQDERTDALAAIDRFIKLHPAHPVMDYALYLKGLINFNEKLGLFGGVIGQDPSERDQQSMRESFESFKELVTRFPQSRYAEDATLRMNYIVNALARYDVAVARYYFNRGVYLAAANRAQKAITEFQTAPAIEQALYILIKSYEKLGLEPLRADAERVFKQNFPKSEMFAKGLPEERGSWWQFWR
jgi:outer membrane protein assembly factor BamD